MGRAGPEVEVRHAFVSASEALAWLRDLPALWTAADDSGRRLLTEAIFEKVEVLGVQSVTIHPTPEADAQFSTDGRGERSSGDTIQLSIRIESQPVMNIPSYVRRSSEIA